MGSGQRAASSGQQQADGQQQVGSTNSSHREQRAAAIGSNGRQQQAGPAIKRRKHMQEKRRERQGKTRRQRVRAKYAGDVPNSNAQARRVTGKARAGEAAGLTRIEVKEPWCMHAKRIQPPSAPQNRSEVAGARPCQYETAFALVLACTSLRAVVCYHYQPQMKPNPSRNEENP